MDGKPRQLEGRASIQVQFSDADPAGVVWHGKYFDYFDSARCDLLAKIGYGYRAMAESGLLWPVVETQVRFVRAVSFDDLIHVHALLVEWEYRLRINYEIHDNQGRRCTRGHTIQVAVRAESGELCMEVPKFLRDRIVEYQSAEH